MAIETFGNGGISITGERDVNLAGLIALRSGLKLEIKCKGLKIGRVSAYSIAKKRFSLKGNKQKVYDQLNKIVEDAIQKRNLEVMAETGENN